ncbi:hypothetical protein [Desertihabitans brevis]|uniref:hypothetical protein n=1 Tax=Desertihabitans brevis TaxID=2268447 RepID=UPI0018F5BD5A|nr:hypothetical protein [Desertihabitans brevis]
MLDTMEGQGGPHSGPGIELTSLTISSPAPRELGAVLAGHRPQEDVRVRLDPDGHPFCVF